MWELFRNNSPIVNTLIATMFTWGMTAAGASLVFFVKNANKKLLETMLGFAAGVMLAASFWSLLAPAIELSKNFSIPAWIPPSLGFIAGGLFLRLLDAILPHLHFGEPEDKAEGIKTSFKRNTLLLLAVTLHNIPEGLAVGVAFGALLTDNSIGALAAAFTLALGIGIQNFPEGTVISLPLRAGGMSKFKSFWYGQLSGLVEPIAAVLGVIFVSIFQTLLPYALSFAAGAMVYVVVEELIPESQLDNNTDLATLSTIFGFVIMMILDVALG
jgi:ZIP family zinc transporter